MTLDYCPPEFYLNCSNYLRKCLYCKGQDLSKSKIFYNPVSLDTNDLVHPVVSLLEAERKDKDKDSKTKKKNKASKEGLKAERVKAKQLVTQTLKSGAILADGDLHILNGELKLDHKLRTNCYSFTVTKKEYEKALANQLDGWIITNCRKESVVVLPEKVFIKLLHFLKELKKT